MYSYHDLIDIPINRLHETFLAAFSDYQITVDIPVERLQNMLDRRGFRPEASLGAFDGEELVGFLFHGMRDWEGKPTAYDTGTGVIPSCRKQGITTTMLEQVRALLPLIGVEQWLLEVLCENEGAKRLYERQGFRITRSFDCYSMSDPKTLKMTDMDHDIHISDSFSKEQWDLMRSFWDNSPSWQNSIDSLQAVPGCFTYVTVCEQDRIIGYGIIERSTGDIPQLAVQPSYRQKGIGSMILEKLAAMAECDVLKVTNADSRDDALRSFLLHHGFSKTVSQYEMMCDL